MTMNPIPPIKINIAKTKGTAQESLKISKFSEKVENPALQNAEIE